LRSLEAKIRALPSTAKAYASPKEYSSQTARALARLDRPNFSEEKILTEVSAETHLMTAR
jgi:hypothetical protein